MKNGSLVSLFLISSMLLTGCSAIKLTVTGWPSQFCYSKEEQSGADQGMECIVGGTIVHGAIAAGLFFYNPVAMGMYLGTHFTLGFVKDVNDAEEAAEKRKGCE